MSVLCCESCTQLCIGADLKWPRKINPKRWLIRRNLFPWNFLPPGKWIGHRPTASQGKIEAYQYLWGFNLIGLSYDLDLMLLRCSCVPKHLNVDCINYVHDCMYLVFLNQFTNNFLNEIKIWSTHITFFITIVAYSFRRFINHFLISLA